MLNNLKNIFFLYYRQVKLSSGFRAEHKSLSVIIFLMGLISIFLNKEIITELTNYPKTLNFILIVSLFYVIFLKFNLLTRITFVVFKGIPYFYWEINNLTRLVFYLSYNIILTILTLLVISRIYRVINMYNSDLCYIIFLYNCIFTTILYFTYMYFIYEGIDFKKIDNSKIKLGIPSLILLLLFDIFKTIFQYFTIYCDPLNGQPVDSENVNHQGNTDNNLK